MGIVSSMKQARIHLLVKMYRACPVKKNKILFWSDLGHRYSCNPRYLSEYLLREHPGEFDIVWMFDRDTMIPEELPKEIRVVRYFSEAFLYEISTAGYIVCNQRIPRFFHMNRRKAQVYLQTWHSSLRLKAIEGDAAEALGADYVENAKYDSMQISYILSGCEFSSGIFQNAFWYHGQVLPTGTPRIDYLLRESGNAETLLAKAGLSKDYKYLLYAPTFRKGDDMSAYQVDFNTLLETLHGSFGGKWKVLYRLHPNMAGRVRLDHLPENCIDMTMYNDMQELLVLSDILMTDYSSSMFDYAYLKKPCILYVSDLERYIQHERRLYFDIRKLPFVLAENNEELNEKMRVFDAEKYADGVEAFMRKIGSYEDGHACERIYREVFQGGQK